MTYGKQVCTVCGSFGGPQSFHPQSGWNWFFRVRLCPEHAKSHGHLVTQAVDKANAACVERRKQLTNRKEQP